MDLEDKFDVVIIGTGLAESILSAACSRVGKSVLHLDKNSFYGESWSSFNFEQLVEWLKYGKVSDALYFSSSDPVEQVDVEEQSPNRQIVNWSDFYKTIDNIEIISYLINEEASQQGESSNQSIIVVSGEAANTENKDDQNRKKDKWWSTADFKKLSRKFNIDLCPKLLFATGSMVQLLVNSNISRYMSFKSVTRMLCNKDDSLKLIQVPYSRQTIFLSDSISLIEKRILMKFIQFCLEVEKNDELINEFIDKPFTSLMVDKGLTPFLQKVVLQCVLFTNNNDIQTKDAMMLIKKFVDSSGRYGSTPFLSTLYGSGEVPQSFCRLSAVFAGTFLLNNTIDKVIINKSESINEAAAAAAAAADDDDGGENAPQQQTTTFELVYRSKHIKAEHLITSIDSTPKQLINSTERSMLSRGIFITNRSIKQVSDESNLNREISLICLDFGDNYHNVYLLELSSTLCVCPDDLYLVYIWTDSVQATAKQDLLPIVKRLFNFSSKTVVDHHEKKESDDDDLKPNIIWSCYYNCEYINGPKNKNLFQNHHILSTAYNELDYDRTIEEARQLFTKIYPDEVFCERAPEAEEIVFEPMPKIDEQENGVKEDDPMDV